MQRPETNCKRFVVQFRKIISGQKTGLVARAFARDKASSSIPVR